MTIIAGLYASVFGRVLGRLTGAVAAAVGIGAYTLLVGENAAVVQAAIMGGRGCSPRKSGSASTTGALLVADDGYAPANPPEWIEKLRPGVVLLSVEAGDQRGLPDAETMRAVQGYMLLRTDRNGWIEIKTDGERMWVDVERR